MRPGTLGAATTSDAVGWNGSELFVWQGSGGARYSVDGDRWTSATTLGAPGLEVEGAVFPLLLPSVVWISKERVLLWGGGVGCLPLSGDCDDAFIYDTGRDTWTRLNPKNPPRGRTHHVTLWTGDQVLVWGGRRREPSGAEEQLADGAIYDPAQDEWRAMTTVGAPSKRDHHTAVWTGSRMVVWGGSRWTDDPDFEEEPRIFLGDGAVYDPATDRWTPMTPVGAPSQRQGHSVVWTGREMIVWGGEGCGPRPNHICGDGGAYDPSLDRWRPLSSKDAPSARTLHTAVWTGEKMLVWGGAASGTLFGDGAVYDAATDSWVPMTTKGAPYARGMHWAFWTGSQMLVWGGGGPESLVGSNDGALFTLE